MLQTRIIVWTWTEPVGGCDAMAFNIPERHWPSVRRAIASLAAAAGDEWGESIPAATVVERPSCVAAPARLRHVLSALASACRYSSAEGLYVRDLPDLASAGIARS